MDAKRKKSLKIYEIFKDGIEFEMEYMYDADYGKKKILLTLLGDKDSFEYWRPEFIYRCSDRKCRGALVEHKEGGLHCHSSRR